MMADAAAKRLAKLIALPDSRTERELRVAADKIQAALETARRQERKAVMSWLLSLKDTDPTIRALYRDLARDIKEGSHLPKVNGADDG